MTNQPSNADSRRSFGGLFLDSRLPDQVFAQSSGSYVFFEFARAFSAGAWKLFSEIALRAGDATVWCRCMDPDADAYYGSNFAQPAEFRFVARQAADVYVARMHEWPKESPADALAYRGDALAWAGDAGAWACWGQRDAGLCVLRFTDGTLAQQALKDPFVGMVPVMTLEVALQDVAANELPDERFAFFSERMRSCYGRTIA